MIDGVLVWRWFLKIYILRVFEDVVTSRCWRCYLGLKPGKNMRGEYDGFGGMRRFGLATKELWVPLNAELKHTYRPNPNKKHPLVFEMKPPPSKRMVCPCCGWSLRTSGWGCKKNQKLVSFSGNGTHRWKWSESKTKMSSTEHQMWAVLNNLNNSQIIFMHPCSEGSLIFLDFRVKSISQKN